MLFYVFEFMPVGRRLLFVGRGRSVARLSGIRVSRLRWGALVASGLVSVAQPCHLAAGDGGDVAGEVSHSMTDGSPVRVFSR